MVFAPPSDENVLVADEVVYYRAPKHVMSLAEPAIETFAVLVLVVAVLVQPSFEELGTGLLLILLSILVVVRWIRARDFGFGAGAVAIVVGYVVLSNDIDPLTLVPLIGLGFIARLAFRSLRWYSYEIRYLTNRRIIEATGFLGLRVASMPVARVTDIVLSHSATGEALGYGKLRIESAGEDQALSNINFLVEPGSFHRLAVRLSTKPGKIDVKGFIDVEPSR